MNWIRQEKRLAIYLRDGLACVWCGNDIEHGAALALDHLKPVATGGGNDTNNLVTSCEVCNKSRGVRSPLRFARSVASYLNHGITALQIVAHVRNTARRVLPLTEAKTYIARRGSAARALSHIKRAKR